ncbi:MAG: YigZ family protein [Lewinella sp.]|nr:YigZ family protein [Lewinella sp.]
MSNASDTYRTLGQAAEGEFRDRGSKFLAYVAPILSVDEAMAFLEDIRKAHPKARHHCYAYRLGMDGNNFRANDDGEPSGTAGRPILGQIDSFDLTNVMAVVVRYFGGTLLGTSGLINAYKQSTALAFEQAEIIERTVEDLFTIAFDYGLMSRVMNGVNSLPVDMVEQRFNLTAELDIAIRQSLVEDTLRRLKAQIADVYLEQADEMETIPGCTITRIGTR